MNRNEWLVPRSEEIGIGTGFFCAKNSLKLMGKGSEFKK
jgi:hypothetical protein